MTVFITSSADDPETGELNPSNSFLAELRRAVPEGCRALYICSDPDDAVTADRYAAVTLSRFARAGFRFSDFAVLDSRNAHRAGELIQEAGLIVLSGGDVPTQNRFFTAISLRELLRGFEGVVVGISAGSMNSADCVYAQPEYEEEAADPDYRKFLRGLGLTEYSILPHFQLIRDTVLAGKRVFEDISCPDSLSGHDFYCLPDGSYLFIGNGRTELRGEAWRIHAGKMEPFCKEGEVRLLP